MHKDKQKRVFSSFPTFQFIAWATYRRVVYYVFKLYISSVFSVLLQLRLRLHCIIITYLS